MTDQPRDLVEHFFRHESGRLVALLARSLGVGRLDLIEDVVQASLMQALQTWGHRGIPDDPAGWLYRTARNQAIDALRRERVQARILPHVTDSEEIKSDEPLFAEEIADEPLRLLFLCCHESVPIESRVALALRTVCGFSTAEIARGLLTTDANVQKRIARAKGRLRDEPDAWESPGLSSLRGRLDAEAHRQGPLAGLALLATVPPDQIPARYPAWSAVVGELHFRAGDLHAAEHAWSEALALGPAKADQDLILKRLAECRELRVAQMLI